MLFQRTDTFTLKLDTGHFNYESELSRSLKVNLIEAKNQS